MGIERMLFSLRKTSHNPKSSPTRADREALRIAYGSAFVQGGRADRHPLKWVSTSFLAPWGEYTQ